MYSTLFSFEFPSFFVFSHFLGKIFIYSASAKKGGYDFVRFGRNWEEMGLMGNRRGAYKKRSARPMEPPGGEPGPTPDSPPRREAQDEDDAADIAAAGEGQHGGWFASLWEQTQQNTQTTIRFFESEHKKNVEKFEAGLKTMTEEVADGIHSQLEGRKSLKALREERVRARFASGLCWRSARPQLSSPPYNGFKD